MLKEEWKDITGYEGLYQVSNLGRVKSLKYGKERILSPGKTRNGYLWVQLCKNGIEKCYSVHRLVASAFLDNPDNFPCVNHKDLNRHNNKVSNLEWCTYQYNMRYSTAKKIGCFKDGKLIKVYNAIRDVKNDGFHHGHVCSALKGQQKSSGGFQWKYL